MSDDGEKFGLTKTSSEGGLQPETMTQQPSPDNQAARTYEGIQQILEEFVELENSVFCYEICFKWGIYAEGWASPAQGDDEFVLQITGPGNVGIEDKYGVDKIFAGNAEAHLQELGWQPFDDRATFPSNGHSNFRCTVNRDGLMDGAVATLLSRSFDLYNIDDSDLDYPYSDNTGVFVNPDFHKKLQEEAIVSDEVEPEAEKPRTIRIGGQEYPAEQFEAAMAETQASTDEESAADKDSGSFIDAPINLIKELRETDSGGFKLWAFLFPVGFLYSYNSREEAKNIALSILIPTLVLSLAFYVLPAGLFMIGDALMWIWVVYVSYLVSTRSNALVADGASYDLKDGVLSQLAFGVVSYIIWSL